MPRPKRSRLRAGCCSRPDRPRSTCAGRSIGAPRWRRPRAREAPVPGAASDAARLGPAPARARHRGEPASRRARQDVVRDRQPGAHPLQHRLARHRRLRHRSRRDPVGLDRRTRGERLGGRDAPAAARSAAHRLGAHAPRHSISIGDRQLGRRVDGARRGRRHRGGRRPHRRQRRRRQQDRHLHGRGAGATSRHSVLRRGAGVAPSTSLLHRATRSRSRSERPTRWSKCSAGASRRPKRWR